MYFLLTRNIVQNWFNCFYFTSGRHALTLILLARKKGLNKNELCVTLSLSLSILSILVFVVGGLIILGSYMSSEGFDSALWSFTFLRTPLLPFYLWSKFWFSTEGVSSQSCQCPCLLSSRHHMLSLYSLWVRMNSYTL